MVCVRRLGPCHSRSGPDRSSRLVCQTLASVRVVCHGCFESLLRTFDYETPRSLQRRSWSLTYAPHSSFISVSERDDGCIVDSHPRSSPLSRPLYDWLYGCAAWLCWWRTLRLRVPNVEYFSPLLFSLSRLRCTISRVLSLSLSHLCTLPCD
ncbi:hypothetical protein BDW22DRAFT_1111107 [Trametopsis cervina]|nr:hypothetical protein BDW22DRAFT_1111107 [Trametopsis cervina]